MDARAQLALLAKAKAVFERPGYFLSFPALAPISFAPAAMDFARSEDPLARAALLDFSRLVNVAPAGTLFDGEGDNYLWDAYDHWLTAMELAADTLSPADQAALDAAQAVLQQKDAAGLPTDSDIVIAYKTCRDAWLNAQQAYKSAQMTAASSADPAVQAAWTGGEEASLRQAIVDAESDWQTTGHRAEVEAARATVNRLQAGLPHVAWTAWRTAFQPDLDLATDPDTNQSFGPSGYAPGDVTRQPWVSFTLGGEEIVNLVNSAPPELKNLLTDDGPTDIQSITLEARSAAVVRPWFDPSLFGARFWRLPSGEPPLSDGLVPPAGAWPAYVSGVVFARNIKVIAGDGASRPITALSPLMLRAEVMQSLRATAIARSSPPVERAMAPVAAERWAPAAGQVAGSVRLAQRLATFERIGGVAGGSPPPSGPGAAVAAAQRIPLALAARASEISPARRLMIATRPIGIVFSPPPTPSPPAPSPPPQPVTDDRVSILAFICTPLPKTPDPDPALRW